MDGILNTAGVGGGVLFNVDEVASKVGGKSAVGDQSEQQRDMLSLLQHAAREGSEHGRVEAGEEAQVKMAYAKLEKLAPGLRLS